MGGTLGMAMLGQAEGRRVVSCIGAGEQIGVGLTVACVHVSCPA